MSIYYTKTHKLPGSDYREVYSKAHNLYKQIKSKSKRKPYLRSAYFEKDKIFLEFFWQHLWQKNWRDRMRRLKYFPCAVDLIRYSKHNPISKQNPNKPFEIIHRFTGITPKNNLFVVQIKKNKKTNGKWLISVFPKKK